MKQPPKVLVVEDDSAINNIVCKRLKRDGLSVTPAFSGTEAQLLLKGESFDMMICDLMLPGATGEEVVKAARAASKTMPILVVSARDGVGDRVDLLKLGADDYLVKPFDLDELSARVEVQLRHAESFAEGRPAADGRVRIAGWELDASARTLTAAGRPVDLTRTEYEIAELLATHPNQVFSKRALYEHVWGECYDGQESTVSAHVSNLRAKLKESGTESYIQTVWGIGFRFVPSL